VLVRPSLRSSRYFEMAMFVLQTRCRTTNGREHGTRAEPLTKQTAEELQPSTEVALVGMTHVVCCLPGDMNLPRVEARI
jgi:hypothetical protein